MPKGAGLVWGGEGAAPATPRPSARRRPRTRGSLSPEHRRRRLGPGRRVSANRPRAPLRNGRRQARPLGGKAWHSSLGAGEGLGERKRGRLQPRAGLPQAHRGRCSRRIYPFPAQMSSPERRPEGRAAPRPRPPPPAAPPRAPAPPPRPGPARPARGQRGPSPVAGRPAGSAPGRGRRLTLTRIS